MKLSLLWNINMKTMVKCGEMEDCETMLASGLATFDMASDQHSHARSTPAGTLRSWRMALPQILGVPSEVSGDE